MQPMWLAVILLLGLSGCASPSAVQQPSQSSVIRNFQYVAPGICRGAQPDEEGLRALKAMGIKTIVSLRVPPRLIAQEAKQAEALGLDFVSLPLSNYDEPSDTEVKTFLAVVTDPRRQPVFVHCRQGQLRTGALMASYRVLEEGWSAEQAYTEAKALGFDDQYPWYRPLKRFIKDLDRVQVASEPSPQ
ncbi:MAG: dual specificity protein phosphatase family protein [Candidatus Omnitrophica bacterium]|nr:dual specificity protein phosphatase family protein [Candidatus Omnitrophota bacterium]